MLRRLALTLAVLTLTAPGLGARADARAGRADAVLAAAARDLARGDARGAERRLERTLSAAADARIALRYAELVLPLDGRLPKRDAGALTAAATRYLAAVERAFAVAAPAGETDAERRALLHAAWATALLARYEQSFALVESAGRLQDATTLRCLRQIAALAVSRDQLAHAERALELAKQYVPQDLMVATELGRVLLARGRADRAVRLLSERFSIEPHRLETRRDLAYALASAGRAGEALALLGAERARCEADAACALEAARIALEAGELEQALSYAARRTASDPSDLDALFVTGDVHVRAGRLAAAREVYERVLRVRPDSLRAKQALAQLAASSNREPP